MKFQRVAHQEVIGKEQTWKNKKREMSSDCQGHCLGLSYLRVTRSESIAISIDKEMF